MILAQPHANWALDRQSCSGMLPSVSPKQMYGFPLMCTWFKQKSNLTIYRWHWSLGNLSKNRKNKLEHPQLVPSAPTVRIAGYQFINWSPYMSWFLSKMKLQRPDRRFGHPSTDKFIELLQQSELWEKGPKPRRILEKIERCCSLCQTNGRESRWFKFNLRNDKDCNNTVYADIFHTFIKGQYFTL